MSALPRIEGDPKYVGWYWLFTGSVSLGLAGWQLGYWKPSYRVFTGHDGILYFRKDVLECLGPVKAPQPDLPESANSKVAEHSPLPIERERAWFIYDANGRCVAMVNAPATGPALSNEHVRDLLVSSVNGYGKLKPAAEELTKVVREHLQKCKNHEGDIWHRTAQALSKVEEALNQ